MQGLRPESILSYGVVGLGFLLALLAYRLLGREQQKEQPHRSILVAIHVFMIFSAVLCVIGLGSEYLRGKTTVPDNKTEDRLTARIAELEAQLARALTQSNEISSAKSSKANQEQDVALAESMEALMDTRTVSFFITSSGDDIRNHAKVIRNGIARLKGQQ